MEFHIIDCYFKVLNKLNNLSKFNVSRETLFFSTKIVKATFQYFFVSQIDESVVNQRKLVKDRQQCFT